MERLGFLKYEGGKWIFRSYRQQGKWELPLKIKDIEVFYRKKIPAKKMTFLKTILVAAKIEYDHDKDEWFVVGTELDYD